jgi:hypothetical protein
VAGAEYRRPITLSSSQKFPGKIFFLNRYEIGIIIYYFYTRVIYIYLIIYTMVLKLGSKKLILYLANRDLVDVHKGLIPLVKNKGADAFDLYDPTLVENTRGLWSHTNVRKDKVDMFPQQELLDMLLSL